ncbi:MAG: hypothetical protein K2N48_00060 [Muribaculaceae bacterium]|nr:hypothetical protein [Muribaculaceae bacterium]
MNNIINVRIKLITGLMLMSCTFCYGENYFKTLLGKTDKETKAKVDAVWNHFFTPGNLDVYENEDQNSVYYLDADKGFILDTGNNDVRTEGMSYGMMISVQLDHPDVFDRLWRWSKEHMAYDTDSPWDGYFCWQCTPDGIKIGGSNASDGELYYVTSLLLAGEKWNKPDYTAEANKILEKIMSKDGLTTGVYNLFDDDTKLITFVPDNVGHTFTDPSYMLPAFLDMWAEKASSNNDFWREAADAARNHLVCSAHIDTGLHPDYSNYDATPYAWPLAGYDTSIYMYDAIRCAMNIGMDSYLNGKDIERQRVVMCRMLDFFKRDGFTHAHFSLDGNEVFDNYTCGMTGSNAVGAIALVSSDDPEKRTLAKEFIEHLWNTEPPKGKYRYYEGMVYFLSLLHVSGNFSLRQ